MKLQCSERRFLSRTSCQQHKKCAEVLRRAYEELIQGKASEELLEVYFRYAGRMGLQPLGSKDVKGLADRYHAHLANAQMQHKEHALLPWVRKGDREHSEAIWPIAVYLDKVRSAHNVGSILRTVDAFALGKVYFSGGMAFADHKQVRDAAMGASDWVECFQGVGLAELPQPVIALETSTSAISLFDFIFPKAFTLVVGNEEYGCSDEALKLADYLIEIPMRGRKNSLNVANAFAVAAAEITRQRALRSVWKI